MYEDKHLNSANESRLFLNTFVLAKSNLVLAVAIVVILCDESNSINLFPRKFSILGIVSVVILLQ